MKVECLYISPDSEGLCEKAARTCYDSSNKMTVNSRETLLPRLIQSGHMSVFEHATASFSIEGVSRAMSHQIVRHRLSSFSQRSQRYVNEELFEYITPPTILEKNEALSVYKELMHTINKQYTKLIDLGIKREDVRFILPNACATDLIMTANFREWLHIIDMRVSEGAQWEIRELIIRIWKILYLDAPNIFSGQYFESFSKDSKYKKRIFQEKILEK